MTTHLDQSADITHQPTLARHALLGVLLQLDVVRDLALRSEGFDLVLAVIPLLHIVGLAHAEGAARVNEGGVGIADIGG